jgi:hypothetical protein
MKHTASRDRTTMVISQELFITTAVRNPNQKEKKTSASSDFLRN